MVVILAGKITTPFDLRTLCVVGLEVGNKKVDSSCRTTVMPMMFSRNGEIPKMTIGLLT